MALVDTGREGIDVLKFGDALFTLDTSWSKYEEGFSREYSLSKAGYSVRRTEFLDVGGRLSKRGKDTPIYQIWIRRGKTHTDKRVRPRTAGKFGGDTKPRISRIRTGRECHQFVDGECGHGKRKIPCDRVTFSRCKEQNIRVQKQEHPPKTGSSYVARRNVRVTAVTKGRRRK